MGDATVSAAAAAASAAAQYKKLKEDFVSNLTGGSAGEVLLVTAIAPISALVWSVLQRRRAFFQRYSPLAFVVDFLLNVTAILLAITLYAGQPVLLSGLLFAQAVFVLALPRSSHADRAAAEAATSRRVSQRLQVASAAPGSQRAGQQQQQQQQQLPLLPKKAFLTTYRGSMMVITCLAILAVDFRIFPRRFAKVETWGTSLMDMGVGSFVFSAGIVAARPVLQELQSRTSGSSTKPNVTVLRRVLASLRHALPLLALGIVRLLSVKGLDYAEHVTEYGVHWNFFFTLGLLPPFVAAAQAALRVVPSYAVLSLLLVGLYQVALEHTRLKAYVLTAPRTDLLSMNREGIFSFIGYLAIFLAGQDTGMYVLPRSGSASSSSSSGGARKSQHSGPQEAVWRRWLAEYRLLVWAAAWWALYQLSVGYPYGLGLTVSRRMANLPYVLWVLSFNTVQLALFAGVDRLVFANKKTKGATTAAAAAAATAADARATAAAAEAATHEETTSRVLRAYNRNGLFVFLVANLLTGLVNLTVPTLDVTPAVSIGILLAYAGVLTAVAVLLDVYDLTIKL